MIDFIDLLVNNVGFGFLLQFVDNDIDDEVCYFCVYVEGFMWFMYVVLQFM